MGLPPVDQQDGEIFCSALLCVERNEHHHGNACRYVGTEGGESGADQNGEGGV